MNVIDKVKSSRVIERAVPNAEGSEVNIRREANDRVSVTWLCGDKRTFTYDSLRSLMKCVELLSPFPDVWMEGVDQHGQTFYAQVDAEGNLWCNANASQDGKIDWKTLRKVLRKAID